MTAETHATMDLETLRSSADAACRLMKVLSNPIVCCCCAN